MALPLASREALRDAFERACIITGGVKETFCKAAGEGGGGQEDGLSGRDQVCEALRCDGFWGHGFSHGKHIFGVLPRGKYGYHRSMCGSI